MSKFVKMDFLSDLVLRMIETLSIDDKNCSINKLNKFSSQLDKKLSKCLMNKELNQEFEDMSKEINVSKAKLTKNVRNPLKETR